MSLSQIGEFSFIIATLGLTLKVTSDFLYPIAVAVSAITTLLTPYPPGIPLLIPGEMFNRKIVDYLRFTRAFNKAFPGFDTDVHGLLSMNELQGVGVEDGQYFVDCVR